MKEEFRWIKGFEGLYQISNLGRVYSLRRVDSLNRQKGGNYVSARLTPTGYVIVSLNKDGKRYTKFLHRVVAQAFIRNPDNKPEVDHIDADKTNNVVENLRWVTRTENMNNPITHVAMSGNALKNPISGDKNPFSRRIAQYTLDGDFVAEYESAGLAKKATSVGLTSIQRCARGERKSAGGFIWKYTAKAKIVAKGRIVKGTNGTPIQQTDTDGNIVAEYVSIQEAARQTGFFAENIGRAVRGEYKSYKGFKWTRKEQ